MAGKYGSDVHTHTHTPASQHLTFLNECETYGDVTPTNDVLYIYQCILRPLVP